MKSFTNRQARNFFITGLVQGVGFRPFVYRLAREERLFGWVRNDAKGVTIHVEGDIDALRRFEQRLKKELPPLARVDTLQIKSSQPEGLKDFHIVDSQDRAKKSTAVLPDMSLCDACLAEMQDPKNRRYRYPFITCTDCGPRYSIIRTVPYDRPNTSMAEFTMCDACRKEYEDPSNRRYHAQPIGCWACGPRLSFWHKTDDRWQETASDKDAKRSSERMIEETARRIEAGQIVAIKGLGGFHLVCDALNDAAIKRLRARKRRPAKPFALMVPSLQTAKLLASLNEKERELLVSKERPIVLLQKKDATILPESVAPGIDRLGLMLPYTPLHYLLLKRLGRPIVATSANLSDEPIIYEGEILRYKLGHVVDAVLDHDRDIVNACDDSVAQVVGDRVQWLRVARGIAPLSLPIETKGAASILAVGANQKNTIALSLENKVVVSAHIGDLNSIESMEYFTRTVETFRRFYDFTPETVVCDLHPGYATTQWAKQRNTHHTYPIQHHYAHVLAVMAEHGYRDKVLAFAFDGTGYGSDGTIWGGEVLLADTQGFERIAHLRPFRLIGGEKAIKEPRRVALALLFELYDLDEVLAMRNPTVKAFKAHEIRLLHQAWQKGLNAPTTTSMGRLFDAMASLFGLCQFQSYEGESGLRLEAVKDRRNPSAPKLFESRGDTIDWTLLVRTIAENGGLSPHDFIHAIGDIVTHFADRYKNLPIVLTGGVFQNRTLIRICLDGPYADRLMLSCNLPPNDAAIALGQLYFAICRQKDRRNTSAL